MSTSFNLRPDVLNILKRKAHNSHCSLDEYVENVLLDYAYADEPNETTRQAIMEAKKVERNPQEVYDNVDAFMKSI